MYALLEVKIQLKKWVWSFIGGVGIQTPIIVVALISVSSAVEDVGVVLLQERGGTGPHNKYSCRRGQKL